jgi:hypothetical protein
MERRIRASSPGGRQIAQAHNFNNGCTICFNSVGLQEAGVPPERFGTALVPMWVMQYAAIFGTNLMAGWLNDGASARAQNPAGHAIHDGGLRYDERARLWFFAIALVHRRTAAAGSRNARAPEQDRAFFSINDLPRGYITEQA